MNKPKVIPLFEILPKTISKSFKREIYDEIEVKHKHNKSNEKDNFEINEIINNTDTPSDKGYDNNINSNWVKENVERGMEGESLVRSILVGIYGESCVKKEPDYAGYDFDVTTKEGKKRIEVKTTANKKYPFFISINELNKAEIYGEEYYIYWVAMEKNKMPVIRIINNPIKELNIDMQFIKRNLDTGICRIEADQFMIKIRQEFIKSFKILLY